MISEVNGTNKSINDLNECQMRSNSNCKSNERRILLKEQSSVVHELNLFSCKLCAESFPSRDLLKNHKETQHSSKTNLNYCLKSAGPSKKPKKLNETTHNLVCSMCSVSFSSKELLFEHILNHNEADLQRAYKSAKAKQRSEIIVFNCDEIEVELKTKNGKEDKVLKSCNSQNNNSENENTEIPPTTTSTKVISSIDRIIDNNMSSSISSSDAINLVDCKPIICACHANETNDLTSQELQIEMVLQCKRCTVIFRRTECFEVHYRTNPDCRKMRTDIGHTKVPVLLCSSCPFILKSLPEMRSHLELHANQNAQGTVTFLCNICKVAFFGVGSIFYTHWFYHSKDINFVASRYSFPKLSIVSVVEDSPMSISSSKNNEGFFYIAEYVCRDCR